MSETYRLAHETDPDRWAVGRFDDEKPGDTGTWLGGECGIGPDSVAEAMRWATELLYRYQVRVVRWEPIRDGLHGWGSYVARIGQPFGAWRVTSYRGQKDMWSLSGEGEWRSYSGTREPCRSVDELVRVDGPLLPVAVHNLSALIAELSITRAVAEAQDQEGLTMNGIDNASGALNALGPPPASSTGRYSAETVTRVVRETARRLFREHPIKDLPSLHSTTVAVQLLELAEHHGAVAVAKALKYMTKTREVQAVRAELLHLIQLADKAVTAAPPGDIDPDVRKAASGLLRAHSISRLFLVDDVEIDSALPELAREDPQIRAEVRSDLNYLVAAVESAISDDLAAREKQEREAFNGR